VNFDYRVVRVVNFGYEPIVDVDRLRVWNEPIVDMEVEVARIGSRNNITRVNLKIWQKLDLR